MPTRAAHRREIEMAFECRRITAIVTQVLNSEAGAAEFRALMDRNAASAEIGKAMAAKDQAKADAVAAKWGQDDLAKSLKLWEQNGAANVYLSAAEQKRFLDEVVATQMPIINANAELKRDYEVFSAAARKYRK